MRFPVTVLVVSGALAEHHLPYPVAFRAGRGTRSHGVRTSADVSGCRNECKRFGVNLTPSAQRDDPVFCFVSFRSAAGYQTGDVLRHEFERRHARFPSIVSIVRRDQTAPDMPDCEFRDLFAYA